MIKSDDFLEEIGATKVLVMLEVAPLSDKFEQIMLTEEQARKMRDALFFILTPKADESLEYQEFQITTNDEVTATFPNVHDSYAEKDIKDPEEEGEVTA